MIIKNARVNRIDEIKWKHYENICWWMTYATEINHVLSTERLCIFNI